ncbi:EbsA family protein [Streptococcus merionis]|uniref:Membrane protein n=1 Tax=Streptococcus merionis TaxID=400065 RepID=A0A239SR93_9STRE|nr:EbsA family protein [Streptococcus merionis]SNU87930.1 membrane protein [Streptococcus merionis]
MIKVFGKLRYHWQPELSWSIIYWSLALTPFFLYLILLYERAKIDLPYFVLLGACVILIFLGLQRYFIIEPDGKLKIISANPWKTCTIPISSIEKIEVTYSSITIFSEKYPQGRDFHMRKWPKKYFVNAIALESTFRGEVELTDHLIKLDYFETYYSDKVRN